MSQTKRNELRGGALNLSVAIQQEYAKLIMTLIRRMADDIKRTTRGLFTETTHHGAMDEEISSQARIAYNALLHKYEPEFRRLAKRATKRMIARAMKNSEVTLRVSLKEMSSAFTLDPAVLTGRLNEIVTASTAEAANLIVLIPAQYLGEVQGQVMRSITSGQGLKDLIPYLNTKYDQNIRHARNVAFDQTRKAYNNINAGRMQANGIKSYEWIHSGGGQHPRKLHQQMNGKVYRLDDPPVIDERTQERGIPGRAVNCRCTMRPIVSFGDDD